MQRNYERAQSIVTRYRDVVVRSPHDQNSVLGDNIIFHLKGGNADEAEWFAGALTAEGIDTRIFATGHRVNVRAFWNWGFMFPGLSVDAIRATLPASTVHLDRYIDVPLSPMLTDADLDDFEEAFTKVMKVRKNITSTIG